jgi:hypothetical protein
MQKLHLAAELGVRRRIETLADAYGRAHAGHFA